MFRTPEIKFTEVNSREKGEELVWNNNGSVSPVTPVIYTDVHDFIDDEYTLEICSRGFMDAPQTGEQDDSE